MMNNLFSMFDPSTSYWSLSWMVILWVMVAMKISANKNTSKLKKLVSAPFNKIFKEMNNLIMENKKKGTEHLMSTMFTLVLFMNVMALLPFNFTPTAHLSISLNLSLCLWVAIMVNSTANSLKKTIIHLTPTGTPPQLMNFMVIIEMVSMLIRPITLCVRLSANMVAGHLLMSLLSNFSLSSSMNITASLLPMMVLIGLESGVAIIQAYVITVLLTLYYNDSF